MPKKMPKEIVNNIRQDYINGILFSDLINKYSLQEGCLCNILSNKRHFDPNYIKPDKIKKNINQFDFINRANLKHNYKYDYSKTIYKEMRSKIIITCKDHGDFEQTADAHIRGQGCYNCRNIFIGNNLRSGVDDIDNFLQKLSIKRCENYINVSKPVNLNCTKCNYIWKTAIYHIKSGTGCPNCSNKICNNEKIDNYIINYNKNIKRLDDYCGSTKKMKWQCLYCNDVWSTIPGSILRGSGCPICKSYKNEKIVANFLKDKNIFFEKKTICLNGSKIRPDFFIPQINLFIEYNGEQHYYPVKFGGMSDEKAIVQFKKQLVRDQNFRSYCLENTINLLEIDGRKFKSKDLFLFLEKYFSNIGNL